VTRYYMPTTIGLLREQIRDGQISDHEQIWAQGDGEEGEYVALMWAAEESQRLLGGPGRRVVVVAESDQPAVDVPTPLSDVVAYFADPADRAVDADPDEDLCWYATQEIDALLGD
jgi:hypothetical protein